MCKVKVLNGDYNQELVRSQDALSDEELANSYALGLYMTAKSDLEMITVEDEKKQQNESNLAKIGEGK